MIVRWVLPAAAVALLSAGCGSQRQATTTLSVVASFYPLFEFAGRVGGDRVRVRTLVPAGAEPHDFEPTPADVAALRAADVFIYNGAGLEPWVARLRREISPSTVTVDSSAGLALMTPHPKGGPDPHVWLDPLLARRQVQNILAGLIRADPDGRSYYEERGTRLQADLAALHGRFAQGLAHCQRRVFITAHAAFGYLASRYRLTMIAISGLTPDAEVPPAKMAAVAREARRHGVRVIYFETLTSPRVAEAIAREVGARTAVLDPLEGLTPEAQRQGKNYVTVMDENLRALAEGLDCR
ncbi:MAG TPA: zinc ABC transporter substrate-binding protein [bacterium]|jgi:zinc transport system substrate-binding protein|nr:zinc ABC transporter substrate-binding protein [bacterium]